MRRSIKKSDAHPSSPDGCHSSLCSTFSHYNFALSKTTHHPPALHLFDADHRPYPNAMQIDSRRLSQDSSRPEQDEPFHPSSHQTTHSLCSDRHGHCCQRQTHQGSERPHLSPAYAQGTPVPGVRSLQLLSPRGTPGALLQSYGHRMMPECQTESHHWHCPQPVL